MPVSRSRSARRFFSRAAVDPRPARSTHGHVQQDSHRSLRLVRVRVEGARQGPGLLRRAVRLEDPVDADPDGKALHDDRRRRRDHRRLPADAERRAGAGALARPPPGRRRRRDRREGEGGRRQRRDGAGEDGRLRHDGGRDRPDRRRVLRCGSRASPRATATSRASRTRSCWNELVTDDVSKAVAFYARIGEFSARSMAMPEGDYTVLESDGQDRAGMMKLPMPGVPQPVGAVRPGRERRRRRRRRRRSSARRRRWRPPTCRTSAGSPCSPIRRARRSASCSLLRDSARHHEQDVAVDVDRQVLELGDRARGGVPRARA